MSENQEAVAKMHAAVPPSRIKQRKGPGGRMLDYVTARFVMDRLDEAVGSENWWDTYEVFGSQSFQCALTVRFPSGVLVTKCGLGSPSDIEPVKGGESDSLKRAAVKFGIGRDLYGEPTDSGTRFPEQRQQQRQQQQRQQQQQPPERMRSQRGNYGG